VPLFKVASFKRRLLNAPRLRGIILYIVNYRFNGKHNHQLSVYIAFAVGWGISSKHAASRTEIEHKIGPKTATCHRINYSLYQE
jgi:hypothetical protein